MLLVSPNPQAVRLGLGWTMAEGVNGVATQFRSRNYKYSTLVEGLIFTTECVWSLGMGMGRCQAPNPTRPMGQPPLIVLQILIPSKDPLICYFKFTHTHLTSKHGLCPTLIHSIKLYHSSNNIYPRQQAHHKTVSLIKGINQAYSSCSSIKKVHHVHQLNQMDVHIIIHDLSHLLCYTITPQHLCINACSNSHEYSCGSSKYKP